MRVLLINPPHLNYYNQYAKYTSITPSLGLLTLASCLLFRGHSCEIIDLNVERACSITSALRKETYQYAGITSTSPTSYNAVRIARLIKQINPSVKTVVGGPHATLRPSDFLSHDCIDHIIMGDGEISFLDLVEQKTADSIGKLIQGIRVDKLDSLPIPAYHLVDWHIYQQSINRNLNDQTISTMFSRGCPYSCAYCANPLLNGNTVRYKGIEAISHEVDYLVQTYGVKLLNIWDDTFTIPKERLHSFCRLMSIRGVKWICNSRPDIISKEDVIEMKKAGCDMIYFGVESSSNEVLEKLGRRYTSECVVRVFQFCRDHGVKTIAGLMIGTPYDSRESILNNYRFIENLRPHGVSYQIFRAYPGTKFYTSNCDDNVTTQRPKNNAFFSYNNASDLTETELLSLYRYGYERFYKGKYT